MLKFKQGPRLYLLDRQQLEKKKRREEKRREEKRRGKKIKKKWREREKKRYRRRHNVFNSVSLQFNSVSLLGYVQQDKTGFSLSTT